MTEQTRVRSPEKMMAVGQLLLELMRVVRGYFQLDVETLLILLCIYDACKAASDAECVEQRGGGISRRMIAERLGLPRETVRRKVLALEELGLVSVNLEGKVDASFASDEAALAQAYDLCDAAVDRYERH